MAILTIWASPNDDGLTAQAKERVAAGMVAGGSETEDVHLNRLNIQRCLVCGNGWGMCRTEGKCILPDDFHMLYDSMRAAQAVVWVTPVYWHDLAEPLKVFLDRLRRCETAHNHALRGKRNMIIACAGGSGLSAIECLTRLEETLRHMGMETVDRLPVTQLNKGYMLPAIAEAGQTFAQSL